MDQLKPGLRENIGQPDKDVGTGFEKHGEPCHTNLQTSSEQGC